VVTTIEISGYIEDLLEALVRAGLYSSKTEAIREAVRRLVESYDLKDLSLRAFKNGGISFQLAVDISGISMDELIWFFLSHDTPPQLGATPTKRSMRGSSRSGIRDWWSWTCPHYMLCLSSTCSVTCLS